MLLLTGHAMWAILKRIDNRASDLNYYGWGGTAWTQPVLPLGRPPFK